MMKMVKSLLLGSAAGLMAVAGAQAADLPVKAKPVEYVKICSLYGAGFYYVPGTDICLKLGSYVRAQAYYGAGTTSTQGPFLVAANVQNSDLQGAPNDFVYRTRYLATIDTRAQTEWGTLRTYTVLGFQHDGPQNVVGANALGIYANRGFIQFAGFTLGKASSFFDIYSIPANSYFGGGSGPWASDTGDAGVMLMAYTAQLGNGVSATIAAEDPRRAAMINVSVTDLGGAGSTNPWIVGATPTPNDANNVRWPDIVGTLRVDQTWGSAQVMAALHDNSAANYTSSATGVCGVVAFPAAATSGLTGNINCGGPDDNLGWAAGFGAFLNMDFINKGDKLNFQVTFAEGAIKYVANTPPALGSPAKFDGSPFPGLIGGSLGVGFFTDGVFANGTQIENTRAWGVAAAYDHRWTPALKTSVYGGYTAFEYNANATALICGSMAVAPATAGSFRAPTNCDPDFAYWAIGSRTQWNITPSLYIGVDVLYSRLDTAFSGGTGIFTAATGLPRNTGTYLIEDQDQFSVTFRAQRDVVP
jgi:hypothetical protein